MIDASELSRIADLIIVISFLALAFSLFFYTILEAVLDFTDSRKQKKKAKEARKAKEAEEAKDKKE